MKNRLFSRYCIFSIAVVLIFGAYPLYMGIRVVSDMITNGTVNSESYPKYIIPYTPISIAIIFSVFMMPVLIKYFKKYASLTASILSSALFLVTELIIESCVTVTGQVVAKLEAWQMYMCYVSPEMYESRTWTPVDVLIGDYHPSFKLHFYAISFIIIIAFTVIFYGFARVILCDERKMIRSLALLSVFTSAFLGLCIFACFTAFYRSGELTVKPISAILMSAFFIVMGLVSGTLAFYISERKRKFVSVFLPPVVSVLTVILMYISEMCLLSGNLYRFGSGLFFKPLGVLIFAPVDICIILISGVLCFFVCNYIGKKE